MMNGRRRAFTRRARGDFNAAAACLGVVLVTNLVVGVLRHRSYLKHRASGGAPPTQHMVIWGMVISTPFLIASAVWIIMGVIEVEWHG